MGWAGLGTMMPAVMDMDEHAHGFGVADGDEES
jgi:hypothetical protein